MLRHYSEVEDVNIISRMRPEIGREDVLQWKYTSQGYYPMKSGYKLGEDLYEATEYQNANMPIVEKRQWTRIWKLRTSPKIRHFIWKASKGALAVAERLRTRGMNAALQCPSCQSGPESICHVLFTCHVAVDAWNAAKLPIPRTGFSNTSIFLNLHHLLACCDKKSISQWIRRSFPWVLWHIWKARNSLFFEKTRITTESIVTKAQEEGEEWFMANDKSNKRMTSGSTQEIQGLNWLPPIAPFTKCNVGSSWDMLLKTGGVAWLLRDHSGKPLYHSRRAYSNTGSKLETDLLSILWAAENAGNMRQNHIIFECSSQQAVEAVLNSGRRQDNQELTSEIHHFLQKFSAWKIQFTAERANRPALEIAQSVTKDQRFQSYISCGAPPWLRSKILEEKCYSNVRTRS